MTHRPPPVAAASASASSASASGSLDALATQILANGHIRVVAPVLRAALTDGLSDIPGLIQRVIARGTVPVIARGLQPTRAAIQAARSITIVAAVHRQVPIETWTAWYRQIPGPQIAAREVPWAWESMWQTLTPSEWTPARITQVVDLLTARAPRVPRPVRQRLRDDWGTDEHHLAQTIKKYLPPDVFATVMARIAFDVVVRPMREIVAESGALLDHEEIEQLCLVAWAQRSGPERCALLQRVRLDLTIKPRTLARLGQLATALLSPQDAYQVPAIRALLRAQPSVGARAQVLTLIAGLPGAEAALERDRVALTELAREIAIVPEAAARRQITSWVTDAWSVIGTPVWTRAVISTLRHATGEALPYVRKCVQAWWNAAEGDARLVDATLVQECLASADRELSTWALVALVPHVAPDATATSLARARGTEPSNGAPGRRAMRPARPT